MQNYIGKRCCLLLRLRIKMKNIFEPHIALCKEQYPDVDFDGWEIEMEAIEIEEME